MEEKSNELKDYLTKGVIQPTQKKGNKTGEIGEKDYTPNPLIKLLRLKKLAGLEHTSIQTTTTGNATVPNTETPDEGNDKAASHLGGGNSFPEGNNPVVDTEPGGRNAKQNTPENKDMANTSTVTEHDISAETEPTNNAKTKKAPDTNTLQDTDAKVNIA